MTKLLMLMAAGAGAAGTYYWLQRGGDLGEVKDKARRVVHQAQDELAGVKDDLSRDGGAPGRVPAHAAGA